MQRILWIPGTALWAAALVAPAPAQTTELASRSTAGVQGNSDSYYCSLSADGRFVAFISRATNLLAVPDANGSDYDIFVRDRVAGTTELASLSTAGVQANSDSYWPRISADGRYVVFVSLATNLFASADTNPSFDVFLRDRQSGTTELVSVSSSGIQGNHQSNYPAISADGRFVTFASQATNLVVPDGNLFLFDVFLRDRQLGTTELVSRSTAGVQGNGNSLTSSVTPDGRFVAFQSGATNLRTVPDSNGADYDMFVRDRWSGTTELVSLSTSGSQGNNYCYNPPEITADGHFVAFSSRASNLIPSGDANGSLDDVFVRDRWAGTTELVTVSTAGIQGNGYCVYGPSISPDGRFVAYSSTATNLVLDADANGSAADAFLRDRQLGTTELVSRSSTGVQGNDDAIQVSVSMDGRYVAFDDSSTNLTVQPDANGPSADVFVRDRGELAPFSSFCFGDGSGAPCPCGNSGGPGRGCQNSFGTGGAHLTASGVASLSADTLQFTSSSELPNALSIFLQGSTAIAPVHYGDGLRCVGGTLKRLRSENATGGSVVYPDGAETPVAARSAALGDPIPLGATRHYQVYYRDTNPGFCQPPAGSTFNVSNAMAIPWGP
jgi:hypothetical protein